MKKSLAILLAAIILAMSVPFSANAASTNGYYTYEISGGEATIIDVDENISGYVIVPSTLGGYPVTTIGANAFSYCSDITKVAIPGCVKTIGKSAFSSTSGLTEAIFCSGVTTIGEYCFDYSGIIKVYLPLTVDTIGYAAWDDAAVFYEGTETQLQAINRPNKGTITDIFRDADISYNQTIPTIGTTEPSEPSEPSEPTEPSEPDNGGDDNGDDNGFDFGAVLDWFLSILTAIINFITMLLS